MYYKNEKLDRVNNYNPTGSPAASVLYQFRNHGQLGISYLYDFAKSPNYLAVSELIRKLGGIPVLRENLFGTGEFFERKQSRRGAGNYEDFAAQTQ